MNINDDTFANIIEKSKCSGKQSNKLEYVSLLRDIFDQKLFPNDFDNWTVQEQYIWINMNIVKFFQNVPQSLINFVPAAFHEINLDRSSMEKPKWLDVQKYRRGQKFVDDHYGSVIFAKILGVMHMYSFNPTLKAIILSERSHTPYLQFQRHLATIKRIFSWYNGEPWIEGTPAYTDLQYTNKMHLMMRRKLRELTNEQIDNEANFVDPWCPDRELLLKDFADACPFEKIGQRPHIMIEKSPYNPKGINNADFAGAQCSFMSMVVFCPQHIGLHDATNEDLEAFCHMWRCYGYYLGLEDKYNFCRGSLEEIKQRIKDLYDYWVIPNFKDHSPEWEHMTRCLVEPMNYFPFVYIPYKAMILIATDILNLNMPNLYGSLNYTEWIAYKSWTFLLRKALKFSIIRYIFNKMVRKIINTAMNFSPEQLTKLQEKSDKQLKQRYKSS
ncbi:uncharacterized protein LOC109859276 [Pseudomyrmex gracilis]|uniref:uncharacterized protein LOC109859276 n=1 Tax=Pseudomyrmex gracilis TaxID=219809 RepID=UPI00099566BD|nr:uncharacterized protein LOC109859276 [Pseudomyrmex gracilis]